MPDSVSVTYNGRILKADLVTFLPSDMTAQLYNAQLDTDGGIVPVWKAHAFTYQPTGVATDTVIDGATTWVRSYTYDGSGNLTTDSGWIKQ